MPKTCSKVWCRKVMNISWHTLAPFILKKSYKLATSRFGYLWPDKKKKKSRKVFQKISKSIKTI
jgi:hypothetical protein